MKSQSNWKLFAGVALLSVSSCAALAQSGQADPNAGSPAATSQDGAPPAGRPHGQWRRGMSSERELDHLTRILSLTADQQKGVKLVLDQQDEQMRAMRNKAQTANQSETTSGEAPETRRTQMEQIHNETNTKIAALLDDSQKKTFADWNAKRKADMEERRQQHGGSPDGAGGPPPPPSE